MTAEQRECRICGEVVPLDQIGTLGGTLACPDCRNPGEGNPEEPDSTGADPRGDADKNGSEAAESDASGGGTGETVDSYHAAAFDGPESGVWPPAHSEWARWMCRKGDDKAPFAPWGDEDADVGCNHHDEPTTCAECHHDARYKWGHRGNYAEIDTAQEWADSHPHLAGDLVFIQREDDPFAFVDGDDVRDPDTGEVHPAFLDVLAELGLTYTDISQSGTGAHAMYRGELPERVKQATFEIDSEPFGANDEPPTVEIYDGKHVCVATGEHVPGTPTEVREWDADALERVLDDYDQLPDRGEREPGERSGFDLKDYDPGATDSDDTTGDIRDVYAALDRLDARRVAERTIVDEWKDPSTAENRAFVPTWAPSGYDGTANFVNAEVWKDTGTRGGYGGPACMAAIDAGLVDDRSCPDAVRGETWWKAVEHLRDLGFSIPEYDGTGDRDDYRTDPREVDVVIDPRRAWRAVERVEPEDLDSDTLAASDDGSTFCCPECSDGVDVVRAVAVREGYVDGCEQPLSEDYADAYAAAREDYGAPLPEYLTTADAVGEFDLALGAIRELEFWHLNTDAVESAITGEGADVDGQAALTLDPTPVDGWRDSDSGESVLVFANGRLCDLALKESDDYPDDSGGFGAFRFVALDAGVIGHPRDPLRGEDFLETYRVARDRYGAPLPRWYAADRDRDDPANVPMLPPSKDLLGEDGAAVDGDSDPLADARADVETLVRSLTGADGDADAVDTPTVVESLPATGKTTAAIKQASEQPATYLAPRKDLQKQAAEKATRHGVSYHILPVLGGAISEDARREAVEYVREHGEGVLRDRWQLHDAVNVPLTGEDTDDSDDVDLDRVTCPTADGEHGDAWALAVVVAHELGYKPREIHENGTALFGADPPCCEDGQTCPYSEKWDSVNSRDAPADLLIGSYGHAHVGGARTYRTRAENGQSKNDPRALVVDEYPGLAFADEFGTEAFDHATWLGRSLSADVDALADLEDLELREDGERTLVGAWLAGDAADASDTVADAVDTLDRRESALRAVESAAEILDEIDTEYLEELDAAEPLERLVDAWGEDGVDSATRTDAVDALAAAVGEIRPGERNGVKEWIDDAVLAELRDATGGGLTVDVDGLPFPNGEALADLVATALDMSRDREDGAVTALRAAREALQGGEGAREVALWADDGYAHPNAHRLLAGVLTPTDAERAELVHTENHAYGADEGTVLKSVRLPDATVLVDRNRHGATVLEPPSRDTEGGTAPLIGLDATARPRLWQLSLSEPVATADIHDSPRERAAFLRDALGLSVVQIGERARAYEGDPDTKDTDGDAALVEHLAEKYAGTYGPRDVDADPIRVGNPAVVTSKGVESVLKEDDRLTDVAEWAHYGDLDGRNDLGEHSLAALLGSSHYGDGYVEHLAALAGEQPTTDRDEAGYGMAIDYGSPTANAALRSMREDRVMQAVLRFTRGEESGAVVFARTAALREDLPVRGEGTIAKTYTENARRVARAARALGAGFTRGDVVEHLEDRHGDDAPDERTVRRHLAELASAGFLGRDRDGPGTAYRYEHRESPGSGEVQADTLPDRPPGQTVYEPHYTPSVRVSPLDGLLSESDLGVTAARSELPAPATAADGADPPD